MWRTRAGAREMKSSSFTCINVSGSASRPVRELKGFERLTLAPGQKKTVRFAIGPEALRYWSASQRNWVVDAGECDVWVGSDSAASLHAAFKLQ